jgi:hypothetical protein
MLSMAVHVGEPKSCHSGRFVALQYQKNLPYRLIFTNPPLTSTTADIL